MFDKVSWGVFFATVAVVFAVYVAHADTCPGCMPPTPEPPVFPPVSGVACPAVGGAVDGCVNHVYMPFVADAGVSGQGGSGILPVRGK